MSREIKVRIWDNEKRRLSYPFPIYSRVIQWNDGHIDNTADLNLSGNVRFEFIQFTGLLDKSGKEIYESDLLAPFGNITQKPQIENCFVVEYSNGSYNIGKESDTDYCIIGNIYENPTLLQ